MWDDGTESFWRPSRLEIRDESSWAPVDLEVSPATAPAAWPGADQYPVALSKVDAEKPESTPPPARGTQVEMHVCRLFAGARWLPLRGGQAVQPAKHYSMRLHS